MRRSLLALFLFFIFHGLVWAEEPPAVSVSFRILPWEMTTDNLYVLNDGKYESLTAVPSNISREYTYRGPNPMRLFRRTNVPAAEGGERYELAGEVRIDPSRSNSLLIVLEVEDGSIRGLFYPFDVADYGGGSFVLFNFTGGPLLAKMGDERIRVESSQLHRFESGRESSSGEENGGRCQILSPEGKGWRMIYNKMVYPQPHARILLFVSQRAADVKPSIKIVRDIIVNDAMRESRDRSILEDDETADSSSDG
ncbi:MAG: hypothetical protein Q7Q73_05975 [Verrucomicrobiota bacterium JB024]|nr:hypothetical protein [Verrucomicrobiota bacterium JB024]